MGSTCKCSNYPERKTIPAPSLSSTGRAKQLQRSPCKSDNSLIAQYVWLCGKDPPTRLLARLGSWWLGLEYDQGPALGVQTIFPRHYHRHTPRLKQSGLSTSTSKTSTSLWACHCHRCSALSSGWMVLRGSKCYNRSSVAVISPALPTDINVKNKSCTADTARMHLSSHWIFIPLLLLKAFKNTSAHQNSCCLLVLFYFRRGCPVED